MGRITNMLPENDDLSLIIYPMYSCSPCFVMLWMYTVIFMYRADKDEDIGTI